MVLCFVEFNDAKCSRTALEALQGYIFVDKKPDSPALGIQFAHFSFLFPFSSAIWSWGPLTGTKNNLIYIQIPMVYNIE